jgi:uncharacterized protein (TIGR02246 family)
MKMPATIKRTVRMSAFASVVAFSGLPAASHARTPAPCQTITQQQVVALFDEWNRALATRKADRVLSTYAPDATLLPTVENGPLVGPEAIGQYFAYFLKQAPQATIKTRIVHVGCNIADDVGLYDFMVEGDQPGTRKQVRARCTFVYAPVHGKWLIVHHHSSALPVASQ